MSEEDASMLGLSHEVKVLNGAILSALSKIKSGCDDATFQRIKDLFDEAVLTSNPKALKEIREILDRTEVDESAVEKYLKLVDQKRKLVEAIDRRDARLATNLSEREMRATVQVLMAILIQVVNDDTVERRLIPNSVGLRFARHFGRPAGPGLDE